MRLNRSPLAPLRNIRHKMRKAATTTGAAMDHAAALTALESSVGTDLFAPQASRVVCIYIFIYVYLSISLSVCLSVYLSIYIFIYHSISG